MSRTEALAGFWYDRLAVNAGTAIFHQWEQLQASGCIENFRITAGKVEGSREEKTGKLETLNLFMRCK